MPEPATPGQRLEQHQYRYRQLAAQIAEIGYITSGTLTHRRTRCSNPNCRCAADPPRLHGPYWQWTTKINGKTVTRRLTTNQAALYAEWINNNKHLNDIISQMRQTATEATQIILNENQYNTPPKV